MALRVTIAGIETDEMRTLAAWIKDKISVDSSITNEGMVRTRPRDLAVDMPDYSATHGRIDRRDPMGPVVLGTYSPQIVFFLGLLGAAAGKLAEIIVKEVVAYYGERKVASLIPDSRPVYIYDANNRPVRKVTLTFTPSETIVVDEPLPSDTPS
jgi:hypothetical protein